jgi:hypothetical protein
MAAISAVNCPTAVGDGQGIDWEISANHQGRLPMTTHHIGKLFGLVLLLALVCGTSGCGGRPFIGSWGARHGSYVYEDEVVEVQMLDRDQLLDFFKDRPKEQVPNDLWHVYLSDQIPKMFPRPGTPRLTLPLAAITGAAVGFVVDQVKSELAKEAELYQAQFGATAYETGFWDFSTDKPDSLSPHYCGFVVTRYAKGFEKGADGKGVPAYRLICALVPAQCLGDDRKTDIRLFAIKPLLFSTNAAKAKVLWTGSKISSAINIALDATWIDKGQGVHQERVATADFVFSAYDLAQIGDQYDLTNAKKWEDQKGPYPLIKDKDKIAGWFAGMPLSFSGDGKTAWNSTFKITVLVTESDQSQAKEAFEWLSKFVGDQKPAIVGAATRPFAQ